MIIHHLSPHTQMISFVVLRNITPYLRTRFSLLFAWFGKISLEVIITLDNLLLLLCADHFPFLPPFISHPSSSSSSSVSIIFGWRPTRTASWCWCPAIPCSTWWSARSSSSASRTRCTSSPTSLFSLSSPTTGGIRCATWCSSFSSCYQWASRRACSEEDFGWRRGARRRRRRRRRW